jgi:ABC-2 type transport system ATP-binding protein
LDLADSSSYSELQRIPNLIEINEPRIKFRVKRDQVGKLLSEILNMHAVDDIAVEDPPLEEVISKVFSDAARDNQNANPSGDKS